MLQPGLGVQDACPGSGIFAWPAEPGCCGQGEHVGHHVEAVLLCGAQVAV